jgi:hypothetical protein
VRQRPSLAKRNLIKRKIERRILHVEFGVSGSDFARLNAEKLFIKLDAFTDIFNVEREMRFD